MKQIITVKANELENFKMFINALGGEIVATKVEQFGFCDNSNLNVFCKIPKKNLKKMLKNT